MNARLKQYALFMEECVFVLCFVVRKGDSNYLDCIRIIMSDPEHQSRGGVLCGFLLCVEEIIKKNRVFSIIIILTVLFACLVPHYRRKYRCFLFLLCTAGFLYAQYSYLSDDVYTKFNQQMIDVALLGFAAYFVFSLITSIKNRKAILGIEITSLAAIWIAVCLFVILNDEITVMSTTRPIILLVKILIPILSGLIFVGLVVFSILYKGKDKNPVFTPLHICFASFICDFFILVLFGSLMKALSFGTATFLAIILCQALVLFFNVMLDTIFISTFTRFTKKFFVQESL